MAFSASQLDTGLETHMSDWIKTSDQKIAARLEQLRAALRSESISYGELAELQSLADHIEPGDVELLEAAGVPEQQDTYEVPFTFLVPVAAASRLDAVDEAWKMWDQGEIKRKIDTGEIEPRNIDHHEVEEVE